MIICTNYSKRISYKTVQLLNAKYQHLHTKNKPYNSLRPNHFASIDSPDVYSIHSSSCLTQTRSLELYKSSHTMDFAKHKYRMPVYAFMLDRLTGPTSPRTRDRAECGFRVGYACPRTNRACTVQFGV